MRAERFGSTQWTGYGSKFLTNSAQWRLGFSIQAIPALALLIGVFFIPESPRWLCLKGREEEAEHNFRRLHGGNSSEEWLTREFDTIRLAIRAEIAEQKNISWGELFRTPPFRKRLATGTFVWAAAMLSGISFVQYCKSFTCLCRKNLTNNPVTFRSTLHLSGSQLQRGPTIASDRSLRFNRANCMYCIAILYRQGRTKTNPHLLLRFTVGQLSHHHRS